MPGKEQEMPKEQSFIRILQELLQEPKEEITKEDIAKLLPYSLIEDLGGKEDDIGKQRALCLIGSLGFLVSSPATFGQEILVKKDGPFDFDPTTGTGLLEEIRQKLPAILLKHGLIQEDPRTPNRYSVDPIISKISKIILSE